MFYITEGIISLFGSLNAARRSNENFTVVDTLGS